MLSFTFYQKNAQYWIQALGMEQHIEGGWFTEVYRSNESISDLPQRYGGGNRTFGTAIYYLLQVRSYIVSYICCVVKSFTLNNRRTPHPRSETSIFLTQLTLRQNNTVALNFVN